MSASRDVRRGTNHLAVVLAEVAVAVVERRREIEARRATLTVVGSRTKGVKAA